MIIICQCFIYKAKRAAAN